MTSVEVDPRIATQARTALCDAGFGGVTVSPPAGHSATHRTHGQRIELTGP